MGAGRHAAPRHSPAPGPRRVPRRVEVATSLLILCGAVLPWVMAMPASGFHLAALDLPPAQVNPNGATGSDPGLAPALPPGVEPPAGPLPGPEAGGDTGIPATVLAAYQGAEGSLAGENPGCRLPWSLVAGIGKVESDHAGGGAVDAAGTTVEPILGPVLSGGPEMAAIADTDGGTLDGDATWERAVGPMQFLPQTWGTYGADGNADGRSDPHNVGDAALGTGRYLCSGGGDLTTPSGRHDAVFTYNHSESYVATVLSWADAYATGGPLPTDVAVAGDPGTPVEAAAPLDLPTLDSTPPDASPLPGPVVDAPVAAPVLAAPPMVKQPARAPAQQGPTTTRNPVRTKSPAATQAPKPDEPTTLPATTTSKPPTTTPKPVPRPKTPVVTITCAGEKVTLAQLPARVAAGKPLTCTVAYRDLTRTITFNVGPAARTTTASATGDQAVLPAGEKTISAKGTGAAAILTALAQQWTKR